MKRRLETASSIAEEVRGANLDARPIRLTPEQFDELHPRHSPAKLARLFCLTCMGDAPSEIARCTSVGCHLFPLRFGRSPWESPKTMHRVLGNVAHGDETDAQIPVEGSGGSTPHRKAAPAGERGKTNPEATALQRARGAA